MSTDVHTPQEKPRIVCEVPIEWGPVVKMYCSNDVIYAVTAKGKTITILNETLQ